MSEARSLHEIVRDMARMRERHEALVPKDGALPDRVSLEELATLEDELRRFDDMCMRTTTRSLMGTGLLWDDVLVNPKAPGVELRVRLRDRVLSEGVETTIAEATQVASVKAGVPVQLADWHRGDLRIGTAWRMEHPTPEGTAIAEVGTLQESTGDEKAQDAAMQNPPGRAKRSASRPDPVFDANYSLF
jgi:hypothetical protein